MNSELRAAALSHPTVAAAAAREALMEEPGMRIEDERSSRLQAARALVSVVIVNYNYGRYLPECIDSVLAQDYPRMEVIVVDDGSTDDSRAIIQGYRGRIAACFQSNGGVISATNTGFLMSHGEVVIFVDADDYLLPGAVAAHAEALQGLGVVRSQAYMTVRRGTELSESRVPLQRATDGDLRSVLLQRGPGSYVCAPTSGNAWARSFLERIFPLPENLKGVAQDCLLMDTAPLFGKTVTLDRRVAVYRLHGANASAALAKVNLENIQDTLLRYEERSARLTEIASGLGHRTFRSDWKAFNWRILTLQHLRGRLSRAPEAPGIAQHLRSAFKVRGTPMKKSMVAGIILSIRIAPTKMAVGIANRVIQLGTM
jgi:glycosyltransferase involved in cell wall biosynthesis